MNKNKIARRHFLQAAAGGAGALSLASLGFYTGCGKNAAKPPNIIYLLTDDHRWDMLGCAGNRIIRTPHLDALANDGVRFKNSYVTTSICMSSRASILTGQYLRRHKINDFGTDFTAAQLADTYPVQLRQAGYRTGFIGKWGVGKNMPARHFDYWRGIPGQPKYEMKDEQGNDIHLTRMMGDQSLDFLRTCSSEQPFCLSVSFKAPHVQDGDPRQFIYDPAYADYYADETIPPPKTAEDRYYAALPEFLKDDKTTARVRWHIRFSDSEKYQEMVKGYYRLITGVDAVVGQIRETLANLGFADNTVILFSGDNGFYLGEHGFAGKWYGHEESIRVPLLVHDPRLPGSRRGQAAELMALNIDIAPTITDLAGITAPPQVQGRSLLPVIYGESGAWRDDFLYEHLFLHNATEENPAASLIPRSEGVVTLDWKYLRYPDQVPVHEELYDLKADPLETTNLAGLPQYQDKLSEMRTRCDELCRSSS